ncbi:hypothetical protein K461DRAFT_219699 [Myriangium duriaei CBS 260.36]|uniref:Uncharacterized protein n=1 Tax=Myriangium duriaei CBS 260.36 TaxID=1168546 RepID=A0A9P4JEX1_9PEZI|nr:hypothetical protein K461DRAFT_219699 [Myriangium duriaei CBS 260.36]
MSTTQYWKPWQESPSLSASMEDFESTAYASDHLSRTPSSMRIPVLRSPVASAYSDTTDDALQNSWSPPAWRKAGSGWFRHQAGLASPMGSRAATPEKAHRLDQLQEEEEDDGDLTAAADIPLPRSPTKGRSISPSASPDRKLAPPGRDIRFSMRADVQHRTEPIEEAVVFVRKSYNRATKSKYRMFLTLLSCLLASSTISFLLSNPVPDPAPDIIKVAGMANTFEPLMHYSEGGHSQVSQLGETSVAVWDLSESVRSTNMTSGPMIVKTLDDLSDSLKSLTHELTSFFANINADIDHILLVMEWAQRELGKLRSLPESKVSTVFSNVHTVLSKVGILENLGTGAQTAAGKFVQDLFGQTNQQRTRNTLERTFMDMLGVLEESINNELTASHSLFAHFEAIDRQFLNLQRTVIRETDAQEREESEVLASLWSRMMGGNAARLKKFEKNKQLLASLRGRTVQNKHVLVDHNGRLLQLRSNLEILRKKLVSPLVRSNQSSSLTVEEQLEGLEGTYASLRSKREAQKARIFEMISEGSNAGSRNPSISANHESYMIESR